MSIDTLYSAFVRAASQGTISATVMPLMGKLVSALGVTALPLTDGKAERSPTEARLTGGTVWAAGTGWSLTLIGTVDDLGRDELTLELLAQTARGFVKLGALVPAQPDSRMPSVDVHGTTTLVPSVLKDLGPEQATVSAIAVDDGESAAPRPGLGGILVLTDTPLAPYAGVLGATQLTLTGSFDPRAAAAIGDKIKLAALAPNAAIDWPKMGVEAVSLGLTTNYVDAYSLEEPRR